MILAFALYKYFPFGGLQRDFVRIALECQRRGHHIRVYTSSWQGDKPEGFDIRLFDIKGSSNHRRMANFQNQLLAVTAQDPVDILVGFNKMAGLDIYYAADTCYLDKVLATRSHIYRMMPRFKHYHQFEETVFSSTSKTHVLAISPLQKPIFQQHYGIQDERYHLLPPGISRDRCRPENAERIRAEFRTEFGLKENDRLVLMIGSGFKTKGLDRAIQAIAGLPDPLKNRTRFFVIGQDKPNSFIRMAQRKGISDQITFLTGRDDVPRFLLGADLLIHPAYNENTGTVLLEALVAGLPVLTTDVCGYAHYIVDAQAGNVVSSPFSQSGFNQLTADMLDSPDRSLWRENAIAFSRKADLYSLPEKAGDIILELAQTNHLNTRKTND